MIGFERNSDIVVMASYAPLFVNVNPGGMQWPSDLILYDAMNSYGSPGYYAQLLFRTHLGDQILDARLNARNPRLFAAAIYDSKAHRLHLKLTPRRCRSPSRSNSRELPTFAVTPRSQR